MLKMSSFYLKNAIVKHLSKENIEEQKTYETFHLNNKSSWIACRCEITCLQFTAHIFNNISWNVLHNSLI